MTSQRLEQSKAGWSMWKDCLCAGEKYTLRVSHHSQIIMRLMILSVRADTALYCNWAFSGKCSMVVAIQQIWLYNVRCFPGSAIWIWPSTHESVYCCFFCDFQNVMGFWCYLDDLLKFLSLAGTYSTTIVPLFNKVKMAILKDLRQSKPKKSSFYFIYLLLSPKNTYSEL